MCCALRSFRGLSIKDHELKALTSLDRRLGKGDVGTLDFAPQTGMGRMANPWPFQKLNSMALVDIRDANGVYELLMKAREEAAK